MFYLDPRDDDLAAAMWPERYVSPPLPPLDGSRATPLETLIPDGAAPGADVLATVTLPFGYPASGSQEGEDFASIHSSPPWIETGRPGVVRNRYGSGEAIYCALPVEREQLEGSRNVFHHLIGLLLPEPSRVEAVAASRVWVSLVDQLDADRMILSLLHYDEQEEGTLAEVTVTVRPPTGHRIGAARRSVDPGDLPIVVAPDGSSATLSGFPLRTFEQIVLDLIPEGN
jgi:hypothetical protein